MQKLFFGNFWCWCNYRTEYSRFPQTLDYDLNTRSSRNEFEDTKKKYKSIMLKSVYFLDSKCLHWIYL
jgi:hypothetical protein